MAPGFARGRAWILYPDFDRHIPRYRIDESDRHIEWQRLDQAVQHSCGQLERLKEKVAKKLDGVESGIIDKPVINGAIS